jgi:outer membrane protein assembly factor BamE (lipoprotein component of BamABCDE complex)
MARQLVVLGLFMVGIGVLCATQAPTAAKRPARPRTKAAASKPRAAAKPKAKAAKKASLPGATNKQSLGFGSTREDVIRLMGKPTRVAKVEQREIWFYDLSTITLGKGEKVVAWSTYNRPLPVNVGAAKPDAPRITVGSSAAALVAAFGTPTTVAMQNQQQVWFFGTRSYAVRDGKVVPQQVAGQSNVIRSSAASHQPKCWCPL